MTPEEKTIEQRLGRVRLEPPGPVVAGSIGEWRLMLTVGSYGIDDGGTILIVQRFASDWEAPQFTDPVGPAFTTVSTNGQARLTPRYQQKTYERPWLKGVAIDVSEESLRPGEEVVVILGDRSRGSPGIRAQTFIESGHEFRVLIDPTNALVFRRLPSSPVFPIIPGETEKLACHLPTTAVCGETGMLFIKGEDRWRNPTEPPPDLSFQWEGTGSASPLAEGRILFERSGAGRLHVRSKSFSCASNPVTIQESPPQFRKYWGDLHAQTDSTVGTGSEEEYFSFARDKAGLDFTSHQGNDFQLTDEDWTRLNDAFEKFNEPGRFAVIPGYEWSANTPAGGDFNVFYRKAWQPIFRSSHWQVPHIPEDKQTPAHPADVMFDRIRANGNGMVCAHVGGRYADIRNYFAQDICPLVEVTSCWGVFEWLLHDAFDEGYVVGIMANSDGHKGRPGAEGPGAGTFGIAGGLTCALAPELTREGIFDALKTRCCYGTTGARIDLSFEANGRQMGSLFHTEEPVTFRAAVRGTGPLDSLSLYRGRELVQTVRPPAFAQESSSRRIRVSWGGSRARARMRRVKWDGAIRIGDGEKIRAARTFAFDSPADGIRGQSETEIRFTSQTTGDADGIEVDLTGNGGTLVLDCEQGRWSVNLADIPRPGDRKHFDLGAIDRFVSVERYPEAQAETFLSLEHRVEAPPDKLAPYWIKAVQCDGESAWASPIYLQKPEGYPKVTEE